MEFKYELITDDTVEITCVRSPEENIEFPGIIDDHIVTAIGRDVIPEDKSNVRTIILPDSIRILEPEAFLDLHYLKEMRLNQGLESLGRKAIYTCPDLLSLMIPSSVTNMGECSVGYMYEHGRSYKLRYFFMQCEEGTEAQAYAEKNEIGYEMI